MSLGRYLKMNNISAILVVKDNPPYLYDSIKSIHDLVSEIIVADIGINSEAKNILKKFDKVKIIEVKKSVPYVELIREDLKKHTEGKYILFLDPDEILTEELKSLIRENLEKYDYFSIPRKNVIFGKWIENSRWWPDYQTRLFKKDTVVWPTKIHQQPKVQGEGFKVEPEEKLAIIHQNYSGLDEYIEKARRYAKSEAGEYIKENKEDISLINTISKSISEFISRFFAEEGYRDGMHGFVLAILQMFYYFLVYFYYWELKKYPEVKEIEIVESSQLFFGQGLYETNHWINEKNLQNENSGVKQKIRSFIIKKLLK